MTHHEEPAQNERAKATVRNKWSPNLIPTVKVHRNAKSDASVKELADDIKHHFDGSNPIILDPRRCLMYENIDKVTYLCCKVKQRPNERGCILVGKYGTRTKVGFHQGGSEERMYRHPGLY